MAGANARKPPGHWGDIRRGPGLTPRDEQAGISVDAITAIIQTHLSKQGIPVAKTLGEINQVPGSPLLVIQLSVSMPAEQLFITASRVELWQIVTPASSPALQTFAVTWLTPIAVAVADGASVNAVILDRALKQLELFVESYRYANEGGNENE